MLSKGYFNVSMDKIEVGTLTRFFYHGVIRDFFQIEGSKSFCNFKCFAIVDSGTSLIGGPKNIIDEVNELLGAHPVEFGEYVLPCESMDSLPNVVISFGGRYE